MYISEEVLSSNVAFKHKTEAEMHLHTFLNKLDIFLFDTETLKHDIRVVRLSELYLLNTLASAKGFDTFDNRKLRVDVRAAYEEASCTYKVDKDSFWQFARTKVMLQRVMMRKRNNLDLCLCNIHYSAQQQECYQLIIEKRWFDTLNELHEKEKHFYKVRLLSETFALKRALGNRERYSNNFIDTLFA